MPIRPEDERWVQYTPYHIFGVLLLLRLHLWRTSTLTLKRAARTIRGGDCCRSSVLTAVSFHVGVLLIVRESSPILDAGMAT